MKYLLISILLFVGALFLMALSLHVAVLLLTASSYIVNGIALMLFPLIIIGFFYSADKALHYLKKFINGKS